MKVNRRFAISLALLILATVSLLFAHRIAVAASELWTLLHPAASQGGGVTVETDRGSYEVNNAIPARAPVIRSSLDDHIGRVSALMGRMPSFSEVSMPPGVRWFRYRPNWDFDTAMQTTTGQVWVTYWPKTDVSHPPEYLGQLYGGALRHFVLPQEPYYFLKLDYQSAPVPSVSGMQLETGKLLNWAVLPNGAVEDSRLLLASMKGQKFIAPICREGNWASGVALYGLLPTGRWQPILSWRAWQAATFGIWRFDANYPLQCAGRFAGYFWVEYEFAGTGAIYRVSNGIIVPFAAGRAYLVTDHAMIVQGAGDQVVEAHSP